MSVDYLILAGPQAAGKSTLVQTICSVDSSIVPLQESRQIIIRNAKKQGAIFMSQSEEVEVIHQDMRRMFTLLSQAQVCNLHVDETNVFTLAHARAHGIDLLEGYFRQYCDLLRKLRAGVVFIDCPPNISWERRQSRYRERLLTFSEEEREATMTRYKTYLNDLYPELLALYDSLDFPKTKVNGTLSLDEVYRNASSAIRNFRSVLI